MESVRDSSQCREGYPSQSWGKAVSSRYRQFFEVLERGPFRLHLMGHSCGLSDRVLLSSIFNHPNLEDVRIYYHDRGEGGNDYFQLCQNISRHFHDKHAMRRKILPCKGEDLNMMSVPLIPHKTH